MIPRVEVSRRAVRATEAPTHDVEHASPEAMNSLVSPRGVWPQGGPARVRSRCTRGGAGRGPKWCGEGGPRT